MRRHSNVSGFVASAVLLSLVAGCATKTPTPKIATPPVGPVPPPTTVTVQTEPSAPPPVSIGPRALPPGAQQPAPVTPMPTPPPPSIAQAPVTPAPPPSGRYIVLNFDNADIETVIHAASEIVGFNYVLSPDVRGKVTVQTSGRIPQEDVFGVLLGILEVHGFTAVKSGSLYKIVRLEGARERAVPTVIGEVPLDGRTGDEIITQIVPVRYASVNDLGVLLRPFVSSRGTLVANRETNVLIITDAAANIRRVLDIVKLVDVQVSLDELQIFPISFADAGEVATILNQLFAGGRLRAGGTPGVTDVGFVEGQFRFIADETTNAVIVTTTPRLWADVEPTIRSLDKMPRQVLIEVLVAEITLNDDTRLGIDWALRGSSGSVPFRVAQQSIQTSSPPSITTPTGFEALGAATAIAGLPGAGLTAFTFTSDKFFAMLNALASDNRVNVVSSPHVMTSENKKAIINVSQSVPIITGQQTSTVSTPGATAGTTSTTITTGGVNQTIEYRDAGVILTVTPRIGERGTVALDIKQEVNSVGPAVAPTNSPSFLKREAETSVVLLNNQTLVLGGLIQDKRTITERGLPFLSKIPVLGYLFGFKENQLEKSELILLITPRVVGTPIDAQRITDQMRRATPELNEAVRSAPRPPTSAPPPSVAPAPAPVPAAPVPAPRRGAPPTTPAPAVPATPPPAPITPPSGVPPIPPAPPQSSGSPTLDESQPSPRSDGRSLPPPVNLLIPPRSE